MQCSAARAGYKHRASVKQEDVILHSSPRERRRKAPKSITEHEDEDGRYSHACRASSEDMMQVMKSMGISDTQKVESTILGSKRFHVFIGVLVVLNAIHIGVDTDLAHPASARVEKLDGLRTFIAVLDNVFCLAWVLEMLLRLFYTRKKYFRDFFNVLDFTLVWLGIFQTWIWPTFFAQYSQSDGVVTTMRALRILRLVRLIKVMYMFENLWLIVRGFTMALRTLVWVLLLLFGAIYTGGIFMTVIVGYECDTEYASWDLCKDHFGTVGRSMFTLFQVMTFESWSTVVARPVLSEKVWMVFFFLGYMLLTSFGLSNVIVGVVVESTLESADQARRKAENEAKDKMFMELQALHALFEEADGDGSGSVDRAEFRAIMKNREVKKKMKKVGLPVECPSTLFDFIDSDESGAITLGEFCDGAMRLKTSPSGSDMQQMLMQVSVMARKVQDIEKVTRAMAEDSGVVPQRLSCEAPSSKRTSIDPWHSSRSRSFADSVKSSKRQTNNTSFAESRVEVDVSHPVDGNESSAFKAPISTLKKSHSSVAFEQLPPATSVTLSDIALEEVQAVAPRPASPRTRLDWALKQVPVASLTPAVYALRQESRCQESFDLPKRISEILDGSGSSRFEPIEQASRPVNVAPESMSSQLPLRLSERRRDDYLPSLLRQSEHQEQQEEQSSRQEGPGKQTVRMEALERSIELVLARVREVMEDMETSREI